MHSFLKKKILASNVNNSYLINKKSLFSHRCIVTKKTLLQLSPIKKNEIEQAILSAEKTFQEYKNKTAFQKQELLQNVVTLLKKHKNEMAHLITSEMGKTISEAKAEVDYAAGYFSYFADQITQTFGHTIPSRNSQKHIYTQLNPIGVCAFITPWNFPLAMGARKIAPALAAGCTCLIKPAPETPVTMLFFAEIIKEALFPPGVLQVLIGDEKKIGDGFSSAPQIKKLSFTGSSHIGKLLYRGSANTLKKLSLELGGIAPFIVFEDANIEKAVTEAMGAKFRNSGQTCAGASFFLIHESIYEKFAKAFLTRVKKIKIGDPFKPSTEFSPYLHEQSKLKAKAHIEDALKKGAKALLSTKDPCLPQILVNCKKSMKIFSEETFSPIAALLSFSTEKEAITLANDTPYGLAAYVMTEDINRPQRILKDLDFGMIGLNDGIFSAPEIPFGGVKESGFGREGGPNSLSEFLVTKMISQKF